MFRLTHILFAAAALSAAPMADAQTDHAQRLGDWHSACDAWGVPATCTSRWQQGKHDQHLVQDYAIVRAVDGVQIFAGRGLYRIVNGKVDGFWEDSRGKILSLSGTYEGNVLNVVWGEASDEIGRSVYTLNDRGMRAVDSVLTETGWRAFMAIDYARAE
ncbi:MAG: hypothetical protein AAF437_01165 [Pseudomonadota bacterium]